MAKTRKEHKDALMKKGVWAEFVDYRSSLVVGGMPANKANEEAVRKFLGDIASLTAGEGGSKNNKKAGPADEVKLVIAKDSEVLKDDKPKQDDEKKREPNTDKSMVSSVPLPPLPVKKAMFANKPPVGEIENITWVADNMRIVDVSAKDCPSLRAWNLLCECRENAYFRSNFWKDHYGKTIPSKSSLDANKPTSGIDGQPTMDLIDRIMGMKAKAEEGEK